MSGTYSERVTIRNWETFEFQVTQESWSLHFYFPGPDSRYNGSWLVINSDEIDDYIAAYRKNWKEYKELKSRVPEGGSFRKDVPIKEGSYKSMSINVGNSGIYSDGICIDSWNIPINNEQELTTLLQNFEYCKAKAPKVMAWLKSN